MFSRALIVLLLVLNLGVAAWWLLRDAPPEPARAASVADVPGLRLVSELPDAERARMLASPAAASRAPAQEPEAVQEDAGAVAKTNVRCYAFGPFDDADAAEAARTALAGTGRRSSVRREAGRSGSHWDVRMPAQADRAAAQALAARIDAAGFKDYYVIAAGGAANSIALGRFGDEDTALRHQAALQAAGFAALVDSPEQADRWWLELELEQAASGDFDPQAARTRAGAGEVRARACAADG